MLGKIFRDSRLCSKDSVGLGRIKEYLHVKSTEAWLVDLVGMSAAILVLEFLNANHCRDDKHVTGSAVETSLTA
jgi:hypothetical protein